MHAILLQSIFSVVNEQTLERGYTKPIETIIWFNQLASVYRLRLDTEQKIFNIMISHTHYESGRVYSCLK